MTPPALDANLNVLDRDLFAGPTEATFDVYRFLRDESPLHWDPKAEVWCVSRHEDVVAVSKQTEIFSSAQGSRPNIPSNPSMINQDEPRHGVLRRFVSKGFTPRQLSMRSDQIRGIATRLIDGVSKRGECDFVAEVAARLPLEMIGQFLGVPFEDLDRLGHWSDVMTLGSDAIDESTIGELTQAFIDYSEYTRALCERKRAEPGDDLISILVNAEVDGERLGDDELIHETLLLLVGGSETSRNVIGGTMELLSRHADQKQLLVDDPGLLPAAVEELIRWHTPILNMRRTVTRDTELHGQAIREGDQVVMLYPAANFDDRVFAEPERLDVTREKNPHLAFGIGVHFCLGASLARTQIRILYEELFRRLPDMHVPAGVTPEYPPSSFVRGFLHLPVEFTPER